MTRAAVQACGLKLFAPTAPAAAVTAVLAPEGTDSGKVVKGFKEQFGGVIAKGHEYFDPVAAVPKDRKSVV